jgi:hypothetical protein
MGIPMVDTEVDGDFEDERIGQIHLEVDKGQGIVLGAIGQYMASPSGLRNEYRKEMAECGSRCCI